MDRAGRGWPGIEGLWASARAKFLAELVRQAIERLLAEEDRPRPRALFHSGDPTLARRVDEALVGFGE
jgi:hypothetical protein